MFHLQNYFQSLKNGCDSGLRSGDTWSKATGVSDFKDRRPVRVEADPHFRNYLCFLRNSLVRNPGHQIRYYWFFRLLPTSGRGGRESHPQTGKTHLWTGTSRHHVWARGFPSSPALRGPLSQTRSCSPRLAPPPRSPLRSLLS